MKVSKMLEKVTYNECIEFASRDSSILSYNSESFTRNNSVAYYILCNSWLLIAENISDVSEYYLLDLLKRDGVLKTIRNCTEWSDTFLQTGVAPYEAIPLISKCDDACQMLSLLRYGKRFSPRNADKVASESIDAFIKVNRWCKMKQHYELPYWLIKLVKFEVDKLLGRHFSIQEKDQSFSSGSAVCISKSQESQAFKAHSSSVLIDKIMSWDKANYGHFQYPNYAYSNEMDTNEYRDLANQSHVQAVPKSYKAARVIAIENSNNGFFLQSCRSALRRYQLTTGGVDYFDSENQDRNAALAIENSVTHEMATVDLSSASDSITVALARQVLPANVVEAIISHRAEKLVYTDSYTAKDKKVRRQKRITSHIFLTSGNPCTFECEGIIFASIALAATHYVERMLHKKLHKPSVFGDDCIVDVMVYDTFCEFLDKLGFKVNLEKSFTGSSDFRESCGTDAYKGQWVSTKYFPRKTIAISHTNGKFACTGEVIESLIQLQHRYYDTFKVQRFIYEVVKLLQPKMTSSLPYTEATDLWEDFPKCKSRCFSGSLVRREVRLTHNKVITEPWPEVRTEGLKIIPNDDGIHYDYSAIIERHYELTVRHPEVTLSYYKQRAYDMWIYMQYLQHGPLYQTPLDELLHVSTSRVNQERDCSQPEMVWTPVWRTRAEI